MIRFNISRGFKWVTVALAAALCSCSFLDEKPETQYDRTIIFSTEKGTMSALDGCYAKRSAYNYKGMILYEMSANSVILGSRLASTTTSAAAGTIGQIKPDDTGYLERIYPAVYDMINNINAFIEGVEAGPLSTEFKKRHIAEAKFLRALGYFDLARLFGRVPIKTKTTESLSDSHIARDQLSTIYQLILADLTDAEQGMPVASKQREGYPHKLAATAYKAKVYNQLACMTQEHLDASKEAKTIDAFIAIFAADRKAMWKLAYDNAMAVKKSGEYTLLPYYYQLFNGNSRNTKESIMELQYSLKYGGESSLTARTAPTPNCTWMPKFVNNWNWGRIMADKTTFAEHWKKYGNGKDLIRKNSSDDQTKYISSNNEQGADPRINVSYVYYEIERINTTSMSCFPKIDFDGSSKYTDQKNSGNNEGLFPPIRKFLDPQATNSRMRFNFVEYRYADLLLLLAEAANELGAGADDTGLSYPAVVEECVEMVLSRARNGNTKQGKNNKIQPESWNYAGMLQDELRVAIMREREYELLGECQEIFDVRRRGTQYMSERILLHNKWLSKVMKPANLSSTDDWEGWGIEAKMGGAFTRNFDWYYDSATDFEWVKKFLFFPIPAKEIRLNDAIQIEDQNIGW